MVHPIIDEYYNYNPYHSRSSKYVENKGLVTNEKVSRSPLSTPGHFTAECSRRSSNTHDGVTTALLPSMHASLSSSLPSFSEPSYLNSIGDIRHLASIPNANINAGIKAPEQGNTKKKRRSLVGAENFPIQQANVPEPPPEEPAVRMTAYGDPNKIAQYFPELN
jgi:glutamine amidotransferase